MYWMRWNFGRKQAASPPPSKTDRFPWLTEFHFISSLRRKQTRLEKASGSRVETALAQKLHILNPYTWHRTQQTQVLHEYSWSTQHNSKCALSAYHVPGPAQVFHMYQLANFSWQRCKAVASLTSILHEGWGSRHSQKARYMLTSKSVEQILPTGLHWMNGIIRAFLADSNYV